jgi:transposase
MAGTTGEESAELKRLRRENAELRRTNDVLKYGCVAMQGRSLA